jgi:hypothetical protein
MYFLPVKTLLVEIFNTKIDRTINQGYLAICQEHFEYKPICVSTYISILFCVAKDYYTVKRKISGFPVHSRDITNQTVPGGE